MTRSIKASELAAVLLCASGNETLPRGDRLDALAARLAGDEDFTATLAGSRIEAVGARVLIGREPGEFRRRPVHSIVLIPGVVSVWDGRYAIEVREPGWAVVAALGRLSGLSRADRAVIDAVPAWARGGLPILIRDDDTAPVLAWRVAEVRALGPRRLALAFAGRAGETTQECDLFRSIRGETPPRDLF